MLHTRSEKLANELAAVGVPARHIHGVVAEVVKLHTDLATFAIEVSADAEPPRQSYTVCSHVPCRRFSTLLKTSDAAFR